jgi:DNA-binding NarL/FixJ family response regulator
MADAPVPPTINVGLVEDQADTLKGMVAAVQASGSMRVQFSAASVAEAKTALATFSPDVLLVDLGLPDGSGLEVISLAAQEHPACEIMVCSIFGDEERVLTSIEAGASGYLLKDTPGLTLDEAIRQIHSGGSPMSPVIARQILQRLRKNPPAVEPVSAKCAQKLLPDTEAPALTVREAEILDLLSRGYTYSEVAGLLSLTVHTIQTHVKHLYSKLSVHSRSEAVFEACKIGLLRGLSPE